MWSGARPNTRRSFRYLQYQAGRYKAGHVSSRWGSKAAHPTDSTPATTPSPRGTHMVAKPALSRVMAVL